MRVTAAVRSVKALVEAKAPQVFANGVVAVNLPAESAACQIAVSLNAGSANETASTIGASSFTRYTLGLSNHRNTSLLQNRMLNFMGAKFETIGTRERTIISITAGPKAIEELAMDVLVPSLLEPMFFKYEMYYPWAQAKNAAVCPVDEAFHQASFSGGLSNKIGYYGGHGSENHRMLEERDEILEAVGRDWHYNHYGMEDAIVTGSGISDGLIQNVVNALSNSPFGNQPAVASKFHAGQVRTAKAGKSVAVVGVDVTGADPAAAACVAAVLGGSVKQYSNLSVLQFSANSADALSAKLAGLSGFNPEDAIANAQLAQALKRATSSSASVISIASGHSAVDVSGADAGAVQSLAASVQSAPKSMVVVGDIHAFPQNTEI